MKKRILSIIMTLSMLVSVLPMFNTVSSAEDVSLTASEPVALVNGTEYYSFTAAWAKAVSSNAAIKLLTNWWAPNKDFSTYASDSEKEYFYKGSLYVPNNKSITIDLNGHVISRGLYGCEPIRNGQVIYLARDASLSIYDSGDGSGRIEDGSSSNGAGGIHADPGSRIYLHSGSIAYCYSSWSGGGVYLDSGAMMFMYGGSMYYNSAGKKAYGGGAIYADTDSRFYMYGGEIYGNKSEYVYTTYDRRKTGLLYGGGAIYANQAYTWLGGGTVKNNKSYVGSAVYVYEGDIYLEGTEITGNAGVELEKKKGAAIYLDRVDKCYIKNTSIHSNHGGGVNIESQDDTDYVLGGEVKIYNNLTDDGTAMDLELGSRLKAADSRRTMISFDNDFKSTSKIGVMPNYTDYVDSNNGCMSNVQNSGVYAKYFYANMETLKIYNGADNKLSIGWKSGQDVDPFIDRVTGVKDKNGNAVKVKNATINKKIRDVTITVPFGTDISQLAVSFEAWFTSAVEPDISTYRDFTEQAVYTLFSDREGISANNWTVNVIVDESDAFNVTVANGTLFGGKNTGRYKYADSVTVTADNIENKRFVRWDASGVTLDNAGEPTVTFTMPKNDVSLTAVYEDLQSSIELEITPPSAGQGFDEFATLALPEGGTAEIPITWTPNVTKPQKGTIYTAVVSLSSEYGFANNIKATVNGNNAADITRINDHTIAVTHPFRAMDKLTQVVNPYLYFEHADSADEFALPETVWISTQADSVNSAAVTWNRDDFWQYSPENGNQQCFVIKGTITLPENVVQNGVSLETSATVYVAEAQAVGMVNMSLQNNGVYTENQELVLSTETEGAEIYYWMTDDGSTPSQPIPPAGQKYTGPIQLTGTEGERVTYKIRAVAAKSGMKTSGFLTHTFHIDIPVDPRPLYEVKVVDKDGNTAGLGGGSYHAGDTVTVKTITTSDKYVFKSWNVTSGTLALTDEQKNSQVFTFTMPEENVTITGEFIDTITKIKLKLDAPQAGQPLSTSAGYEIYNDKSSTPVKSGDSAITPAWDPADTKASYFGQYIAICTLKPNKAEDIIFADSVTAEAEGAAENGVVCQKNSDGSITVYCTFPSTAKAKLQSIPTLPEVYKPYGDDYDVADFLPNTVTIVTDDESINCAGVIWDTGSYLEPDFDDLYDYDKEFKETTVSGEIILPENIELGTDEYGEPISTSVEITVRVSNPNRSEIPAADLKPGIYNENKTVTLSVTDGSTIYYKINGGEEQTYTEPIALNGRAGQSVTTTIQAYTKNTDAYMSSGTAEYTYTIELPAKTCTVEVINGTGSGEYIAGEKINIMAEPKTGMVFTGWKAESVYYTTEQKEETILDADGNEQTITVYVRERHAEPVPNTIFESTSIPITTLTVPELEDGNILEVTAECLDAVTAVDFRMTLPKGGEAMPTEMTTNSDGVSIVPDSFKVTPADITAKYNTTYTMSVDITINEGYALGENTVFNVNGGVAAIRKNDDGSYTVTYIYKTGKDSVISVTQPDALTNLPNGISMGDIISSLPGTLTVTTEGGTVVGVPVVWESNPVEGSYSAERDIAQTFKLRAILQLPEDISNPQELYGVAQISVNGETPYSVTVNGGSGSGNYKKGSVVPVSLTDIPDDKVFTNWNVDEGNVTLNNGAAKSTFFTMPAENVVISAAYRDKIKNVELTVNEPTAGENLPTSVTCETEGVTASLVWTPNDTAAGYNKSYRASIRLKADGANFYEFADSVTVNGNNADVTVNEDKTITVTYDFTTAKAKLTEILQSKLTGVKNGTALADMPLPDRVNVVTEDSDITSAEVEWDMSSAEYDSTNTGEQNFTLRGTIKSDIIDISEYNGFPTLNVTVSAADKAAAPIAEPIEGTYTENQAVTLTTATEDAEVFYSINGGEFVEYTAPIEVNGTIGETVTTVIKAKTVKTGFNESEVAEYTYTIKLPEPTYALTVTGGSGSGEYKAGEEVTIMADAAKENTTFAGWEVSDGTALAAEEKITFTMPSYPVTVTAKYQDKITRLNLTITEPKAGEALDDTISCGDTTGIRETIMAWFTEDVTAQYNTEYWLLAAVVPDSDNFYEFADNAVVAINDKEVYAEKTADGGIIIYASYSTERKTDPIPTVGPTSEPTVEPTASPTTAPTKKPSRGGGSSKKTPVPTTAPTTAPTASPTAAPTSTPKPSSGDNDLPFTDVRKNDWFYDDVYKAYNGGLMYGVTDTLFAPDTDITRGMFVTVLYRMDGEAETAKEYTFNDVPSNAYYADAVAWASKNGIVAGYSNEEYMPDKTISREQMAAIMYRYVKYKGADTSIGENTNILSYDDFDKISEYAIPAMQWSAGSSVMVGRTDTTLNPLETTTRAETAAVLDRIIEYLK